MRWCVRVISLLALLALAGGCASMRGEDESVMPWNTPQQWEGAPSIPGMSGMMR